MILKWNSADFGADIKQVSTKSYEQFRKTFENVQNFRNRGYSIVLDALMVIMKRSAYKLKDFNKYFIIFKCRF